MSDSFKKVLSMLLTVALLFTQTGITVLADDDMDNTPPLITSGVVTAFEPLADDVAEQTVPKGTQRHELNLPDVLDSFIEYMDYTDVTSPAALQITMKVPVIEWESEPEYDPDSEGEYAFTPVLDTAWQLDLGVELPVITVTVEDTPLSQITGSVIMAFEPLDADIATQTVPFDTALDDLKLPDILTATIESDPDTSVSIPVAAWTSAPDYQGFVGDYVFTPEFEPEWTLNPGTDVPIIMVTVQGLQITPLATVSNVSYLDENGVSQNIGSATVIEAATTTLNSGWYVVDSNVTTTNLAVNGDVKIILANNCTLTANGNNGNAGIHVGAGKTLTIYAQSTAEGTMGTLNATAANDAAGIGGNTCIHTPPYDYDPILANSGNINIYGGNITAKGGDNGAGIGAGFWGENGSVILGGNCRINATGGKLAAGIGGGSGSISSTDTDGSGGNILIKGNANVTTQGGGQGAGIGGGFGGNGGIITIEGNAVVNANGGISAAGIGGGERDTFSPYLGSSGGTIIINGGTVTATGGSGSPGAAGIGGGSKGSSGNITITGGKITATGGVEGGAGIGSGSVLSTDNPEQKGIVDTIIIKGGEVEAKGGNNSAGIGGGQWSGGGIIKIEGGKVTATGNNGSVGGAGIGGGAYYKGANVTITDGVVTATGGTSGAGIGGGGGSVAGQAGAGGNVTISGGTVTANGAGTGAGIGGGGGFQPSNNPGTAKVTGGNVTVSGGQPGNSAPLTDGGGETTYPVEVTVTNGIAPVEGAEVVCGIYSALTNASGKATIRLTIGEKSITAKPPASLSGYYEKKGNLTVTSGTNTITIALGTTPPVAPTITTASLPDGAFGVAYSQTLTATGDTPIIWSVTVGSLPSGLSLNASTGEISGTPTAAGTANFTVQASNGVNPAATKPFSITIVNANVPYLDASGFQQEKPGADVTVLAADNMPNSLTAGWYIVTGTGTKTGTITVTGDVHIILTDGCNLTVTGSNNGAGIQVEGTNKLTVYAQSSNEFTMGKLTATGDNFGAGIGGGVGAGGNITINGGAVTATGGTFGAGIGGGVGAGGYITINGGMVTATGNQYGAGIGGGNTGSGGDITINGGTVTASGGVMGAGIGGGGGGGVGGNITINGGMVTATGSNTGASIGGGGGGAGGTIIISGGTVRANKSEIGTAIGGGSNGTQPVDGGSVSIGTGATVTINASGTNNALGGSTTGNITNDGTLIIENGKINTGNNDTFTNNGNLTNNGTITNGGTIINGGTITNNGTINNNSTGTIGGTGNIMGAGTISYIATLTVNKDGTTWSGHGKSFTLRLSTNETTTQTMTGTDGTVTAAVSSGTWKVFDGAEDTGSTITISVANSSATLNYYTVQYSITDAGSASASTINATYNGGSISSGAVVLGGKTLTVTATGMGAMAYTYAWSGTASGSDSTYTITVSEAVNAICTVTGSTTTLGGTVSITGTATFGQTLTVNTDHLTTNPEGAEKGALSYQWKRGGTTNIGANSDQYTLVGADIGQTITVTVTAANCSGSVTSPATTTVSKATQSAPSAPTMVSKTADSITLDTISGAEYSKNGDDWQQSHIFNGLTPNTCYIFYARLAETPTHNASSKSAASVTITTNKAALDGTPTIDSTTPQYLDTLTVDTSGLSANPGGAGAMGTLSYQWNRDGSPISGANSASYTVQTDDIGKAITVTVTAANCQSPVTSAATSAVVKRTPIASDLTYNLAAVDYSGSAHSVSVTASGKTGFGAITVKYDGDATAPTNAGTYTVTADIADGENYAAAAGISLGTFTVNKIAPTTALLDYTLPQTVNYDGGQKSVSVMAKAGVDGLGAITVKYNGSATAPTNAGEYTITAEIAAGTNYLATTTDFTLGTFTINGIDIPAENITITPYSGTYDGVAHGISVTDSGGGTVTYCDTENGTYTTTNPTYTNAGTYTVYFKVTRAGGNFNPYSGSSTVTINKAPLTITGVTISAKTYDGTTAATVESVTFSGNVGTLVLGTDFTATGAFNNANAGTGRTVTVTVALGSTALANNHSLSVTTYNLTSQSIAQAAGSFGFPAAINTIYTPTLTLADLTLSDGYIWDTSSTTLDVSKSGQSFAATYTDPSGNYTAASGSITVNVAKANQTAPAAPTLDTKDATSITLNAINGAEYRLSTGTWQDSETFTGLNPGTDYIFYARLKATANYNASPESAESATITTSKAALTGTPTIDNTAPQYLDTLTADTSGLSANPGGANGMGTLSYQWNRDGSPISGANSASYTVQTDDIGQPITVTVTAANCQIPVTSAATSAVAKRTPIASDLTYSLAAVDYNGSAHSVSVTVSGKTGFGAITVKYDGSTTAPTNAGDYTITVDIAEGANYAAATDVSLGTFTVNKIAPTTALLDYTLPQTVQYNSNPQSVSVTTQAGVDGLGTITVKYNGSATAPTNAGEYTITAEIAAGTNYLATTSDLTLGTFTINGIDIPESDITVTPYSGTFDGAAHSISVTDSGGGTVTYCDTENGTYTTTNPTYTNVGNYTVYFKVTRTGGNYNPYSGSSTVTINKAPLTITGATISAKTYDGATTTTVESVTFSGNVGTLTLGTDFTATGEFNDANAGTGKTVTGTVTLGSTTLANNHSLSITTYSLTNQSIAQAMGSFGSPAAVNTNYTPTLSLADLALSEGYTWDTPSTTLDVSKSGQSFAATYTDPSGNYTAASGSITVNVAKAIPAALTLPTAATITYGAALSTSTLNGGSTTGTFAWTNDAAIPTVVNSGYEVTFTPTDTANYNWTGVSGWDNATSTVRRTVSITVNKAAPVAPTFPTASPITYGAALSTSALSGGTGAGTFAWTNGSTIPTVTNSGYEVTFTPTDTSNYDWTGVTVKQNVAITVNKATPTALTWPTAATINYGAALSTSTLSGGTSGGTFAWTNSSTIPTVTNSGYEVTFTPTDTDNYDWSSVSLTGTVAITVNKATPAAITWPTASPITYGTALTTSTLGGGSATGTFAWTNGATIPTVANSGYGVTFTPTDTDNYDWSGVTLTGTVAITVNKATPVVPTFPTATVITYGEALSTSALSGGTGAGTFAWTNGSTIPTVTNSGYEVTFTPTDTSNYDWTGVTVKQNVAITVNKATPTALTWPTAATITYGAALSTSTLSGGTSAGTFAWTNGATIPTVTNSGYEVTFTPTDTDNYDWTSVILTGTVAITVNKAIPAAITWPTASPIAYGAALSTSTLSGGSTTGTFAWTNDAAIPTVVNSGYEVTFTPTDTDNYDWSGVTLTGTANITVSPKAITITPDAGQSKIYGENDPTFTYTPSEILIAGNSFTGALSRTVGANVGTYAYTLGTLGAGSNYTLSLAAETFEITKATASAVNSAKSVIYSNAATQTVDIAALVSSQKLENDTLSYSVGSVTGANASVIASPSVTESGVLSFTITGGADGNTASIAVTVGGFTNYNPIAVNVNVTLTDKTQVTISGITANNNLTYDGMVKDVDKTNANAGAADISGLSYTYEGTGTTTYGASSTAPSNAGDYKCTVTLTDAACFADDFVINFTITKATITITVDNKTTLTGEFEPSYTFSVSGLVSGEALATLPTVTCPTANMNAAGSYPITAYGATPPAGGNYNNIIYENGTLTVTAQTFTVTFNANGGSVSLASGITDADGKLASLPIPTRSGYTFDGWFTASNGGATVTTNTVFSANTTIYAHWKSNGGNGGGSTGDNGGGNTGGTGGGNDSGNTGGSGDVGTTPTQPAKTVDIIINDQIVKAEIGADGTLTLTYSASDINKYSDESGVFDITVSGHDRVGVNIPISALGNNDLAIHTDFGKIVIPNATLQAIKTLYGDTLRIVITKGSFNITLLDSGKKEINYYDPAHPFVITLPYLLTSGQRAVSIVAVRKDSGKNVILPFAVYENGSASFEIDRTGTYDLINNGKSFMDVTNHWALNCIGFVTAREIFNGTGGGTFAPNGSMTRAMFAQVLANLEGVDLTAYKTSRFTDVSVGAWYVSAVEWAADKGIVNGVGSGRFDPETEITREQMAVMLFNYMRYKGYTVPTGTAAAFADESSINSWAIEAVKAIQKMGIVNGKPGNLFDPKGVATRAEVATVFARFVEHITGVCATENGVAAGNAMNMGEVLAMLPGKENEIVPASEDDGKTEL